MMLRNLQEFDQWCLRLNKASDQNRVVIKKNVLVRSYLTQRNVWPWLVAKPFEINPHRTLWQPNGPWRPWAMAKPLILEDLRGRVQGWGLPGHTHFQDHILAHKLKSTGKFTSP